MNESDIYRKIDRYFDAGLSREEEQGLLKELLPLEGTDPRIDEALAVMLASRLPFKPKARRKPKWPKAAAAAAVIAVAIGAGMTMYHQTTAQPYMTAYVAGIKIDDPQEIMKIIDTQLSDIGESSELFARAVTDDLDDIREAFNTEGI